MAEFLHGNFTEYNGTTLYQFAGTFGFEDATNSQHVQKGKSETLRFVG